MFKLLAGIAIFLLIVIFNACCSGEIGYWKHIETVLMGIAAVLFVVGSTELVKKG